MRLMIFAERKVCCEGYKDSYIRLSNADTETGKIKDESNSVSHQRMLLNAYLDDHEELKEYPRNEFVDDGYSGTNTNRPEYRRMLEGIKAGEFNVVLVKDFSRYSRDYLNIGEDLEYLFPFLGVRFISINDGYGSDDYKGTTGGLDVVMRNIVYAAYSKDLSVKVRTARDHRKKKGQYVESNVPMGYERDPDDKHSLIIDEEPAKIVRRIFDLAISGNTVTEIVAILNHERIPTPSRLRRIKNPACLQYSFDTTDMWTYDSVYVILKRRTYMGDMISNVTLNVTPCSKKRFRQDEKDWIVVSDHHPAIVLREEFETAQKIFRRMPERKFVKYDYPLKGLVRCGCCRRLMKRRKKGYGYICVNRNSSADDGCKRITSSSESDIEENIRKAIMGHLEHDIHRMANSANDCVVKHPHMMSGNRSNNIFSNSSIANLKNEKLRLYEKYVSGDLSRESYLKARAECEARIQSVVDEINAAEKNQTVVSRQAGVNERNDELTDSIRNMPRLTNEIIKNYISDIFVYPDGREEIRWRKEKELL